MIEDEATRGRGEKILLRAGREAAVYVLNKKRSELADIEQRYGVSIEIAIDEGFEGARMTVESSGPRPVAQPRPEPVRIEEDAETDERRDEDEKGEEEAEDRARPLQVALAHPEDEPDDDDCAERQTGGDEDPTKQATG